MKEEVEYNSDDDQNCDLDFENEESFDSDNFHDNDYESSKVEKENEAKFEPEVDVKVKEENHSEDESSYNSVLSPGDDVFDSSVNESICDKEEVDPKIFSLKGAEERKQSSNAVFEKRRKRKKLTKNVPDR